MCVCARVCVLKDLAREEEKEKEGGTVVSMVKQQSLWLPTESGSAAPGMCMLFVQTHTHTLVIILALIFMHAIFLCVR